MSKALSRSFSDHVCSFLFLPEEASLLMPIFYLSLPQHSSFSGLRFPCFCFTTTIKMVTHLVITHLTSDSDRSTLTCLLFAFHKGAQKEPFCWFFLIWADTSNMVCFLAFIAAYPLQSINTINVHNAISNMLQFKPHSVLNRANKAFPATHLYTLLHGHMGSVPQDVPF